VTEALAMIRQASGKESMSHIWVFEWKSLYLLGPKKPRRVKCKVRSMLIISFDIKGIVHREIILAGQTVNSAYYSGILW
jgi:hypothetical protein